MAHDSRPCRTWSAECGRSVGQLVGPAKNLFFSFRKTYAAMLWTEDKFQHQLVGGLSQLNSCLWMVDKTTLCREVLGLSLAAHQQKTEAHWAHPYIAANAERSTMCTMSCEA